MFQEGMTFDNNTEEQKYLILQFMVWGLLTTVVEDFDSLPNEAK
jgi:hypothetical protein